MTRQHQLGFLILGIAAAVLSAGCGEESARVQPPPVVAAPGEATKPCPAPLKVFVSIEPVRFLLDRIATERVRTQSIVAAGQSPETYEPTDGQLNEVQYADVYLTIGVPFEKTWLPHVLELNPIMHVVDLRKGLELRSPESTEGGKTGTSDPHVWLDPTLLAAQIQPILDLVSELDPGHKELFQTQADSLREELTTVDREIRATLATVGPRKFLVFHPAWGYFADRYGLQQVIAQTDGKEPDAEGLRALVDMAKREGVTSVLVQPNFSPVAATAVAEATGGTVTQLDPLSFHVPQTLREAAKALAAPVPSPVARSTP